MSASSISSLTPASYVYSPSANTTSASSPAVASTGATAGLVQQASSLSVNSGIVATLGGVSSSDTQVYDAAGLYNSIAQAGTTTNTASTGGTTSGTTQTPGSAQTALDSSILSNFSSSSTSNTGFYSGTGVLQSTASTSSNLTANWASALQTNPNLSHIVAADSYAQGIIGTISVTA